MSAKVQSKAILQSMVSSSATSTLTSASEDVVYSYYGIVEFVVPNSDLGFSKGDKPPTLTPQTYQKDSERECSDAEQVFVFLSTTVKPLWYRGKESDSHAKSSGSNPSESTMFFSRCRVIF